MARIHYPKLLLLTCTFILAYVLYHMGLFNALPDLLHGHGYITIFIAGLFFSFGFTTPFAIAMFVEMSDVVHPWLAAPIAGLGAVTSDLLIFQFIRFSFVDELRRLNATAVFRYVKDAIHHENVSERVRQYVLWTIAGLLIASPLPDEIGVTILSGVTDIRRGPFAIMGYTLNTIGIAVILLLAASVHRA